LGGICEKSTLQTPFLAIW